MNSALCYNGNAHNGRCTHKIAFVIIARRSIRKPTQLNIILQCRRSNAGNNQLGLVGGCVDPGETCVEAVVRECHEESGIVIQKNRCKYIGNNSGAAIFVVELDAGQWKIPGNSNCTEVYQAWGFHGHQWCSIHQSTSGVHVDNSRFEGKKLWHRTLSALMLARNFFPQA